MPMPAKAVGFTDPLSGTLNHQILPQMHLRWYWAFKDGIPSHDTLNDVMNAIPADLFSECFVSWVAALRDGDDEIVAIDGKSSRRAHGEDGRALHLVSAWATRQRLVLGQESCDEKENEISAIPRLLARLELKGALVTIDAMGCQHGIAAAILAQGADYLLALKGNQKSLHEEVRLYFDRIRPVSPRFVFSRPTASTHPAA